MQHGPSQRQPYLPRMHQGGWGLIGGWACWNVQQDLPGSPSVTAVLLPSPELGQPKLSGKTMGRLSSKEIEKHVWEELGFPMWMWAHQSKVLFLCTLKKPVSSQYHPNTLSYQRSSKPLGSHSSFQLCSNQVGRREDQLDTFLLNCRIPKLKIF